MPDDEDAIRTLYRDLLRCWNGRDANAFAALFTDDGAIIIFDGTLVAGQAEVARHFGAIFARYETPAYVQIVRSLRFLTEEVAVLCGAVGMYSLDQIVNPTLNAVQTLVARKRDDAWRVAHFQNTRAQFPGRPDLVAEMTAELQRALDRN